MQIPHHRVAQHDIAREPRHGRIGELLHPGGKLRLEAGKRHFSQLLLKRLDRIAVLPHRFKIAGGVKPHQRVHINRCEACGQRRL